MSDFNPENAVAVNQTKEGITPADTGSFNVDNAVPVDSSREGNSAWDNFRSEPQQTEDKPQEVADPKTAVEDKKVTAPSSNTKEASEAPLKSNKAQPDNPPEASAKGSGDDNKAPASHTTVPDPQRPPENWFNATLHSAEGSTWSTFVRPFDKNPKDTDQYLQDLEKKHPIASVIGGTAPFLVSAPFLPETLVPNLYLRTAAYFGLVGLGQGLNRAKDDPSKNIADKIQDVSKETLKQMSYGPIFAKAQALQILDRPFVSALARAGVIAAGTGTMNKVYGDNLTAAFKQGGLYGALSLISESPHLAGTVIGRGIINHTNLVAAEFAVKAGVPFNKIDPVSPDVALQAHDAALLMAKNIKGIDQPQIAAAAVKLPDGAIITGTSHDDALQKIGKTQDKDSENYAAEDKDYQAGFSVVNPDGSSKFITRKESKEQPFNLSTGHSEDVQGLNETKFMSNEDPIKIVNPETLKEIAGNEGKMDVNLIPGVAEIAEGLDKASREYVETLKPGEVSDAATFTSSDLRERLGKQAQLFDRLEASLSSTKKMFDKATKESITDTYTRAERGEKQDTPELQKAYDSLQYILANQRERVRALGKGKLENFIENYLPHIWEDPKKAAQLYKFFTRRPLEGSKSFLKKRSIENFSDGIEAGLLPVSWNPVDLTMLKVREMEKYILAHSAINANKANGFMKYVRVGGQAPEGWQKLNDNVSTVYKSPYTTIKEAFDEKVFNKLNAIAKGLGVDTERLLKFKGGSRMEGTLGYSVRGREGAAGTHEDPLLNTATGQRSPDQVKTKFATPLSVLAHEIGHQIDNIFGFKSIFLKDKKFTQQLRDLADLRYEGKDPSEEYKQYVRKGPEKMAVMLEAYIHAPDLFKKTAPDVYKAFEDVLSRDERLKPLLDVKPSLVLGTREDQVDAGGLVISGHLYAHPDSARIFNNYLSPGLSGKSFMYDTYRQAGNTLNQFQLGISAFHLGFTSMDATVSKFALGINKLSSGNYAGALKEFATTPFAPITNILQGRKLLQSWYGKDNGELTNTIAEMMATAGGRAKMDQFYATGAIESMNKALKEGKIVTAAFKVPFYVVEQVARPIMEYIVPRQKMGVFMDMMKMEMERNPGMSHKQMRGIAQKAWNSVDNRMGQLVYDNLFWNRTVKDLAMASVRSLGWNLGTVREIGGGVKDVFGNVNDVIHGKGTQMSYRTAYVMALPIVTGLYGAIYQYLHTGKGPQELKDYFFPKNGAVDNRGQEARVSLPTYMKDVYHYGTDPVGTVVNKFSPVNNAVMEMMRNKDYYGVEIRNVDDPVMQQIADESSFVASQFLPFGFRNQGRDTRSSLGSKVEPFIGIVPAPYDVNMTKAERAAYEFGKDNIPPGARTKDQAQHSQNKYKLMSDYMASKDKAPLDAAVEAGTISKRERNTIEKSAAMTNLQRLTHNLTFEQVNHLLKLATDTERPELEKILEKKRTGKESRGTWTSSEEKMYDQTFNSKE